MMATNSHYPTVRAAAAATLALLACLFLAAGQSEGAPITTLTITDVGGEGCYPEVTNMEPGVWPTCSQGSAACHQSAKRRSASLAPFDEELTLVFRGPMTLSSLAVYYPGATASSAWTRESYWTPSTTSNVAWFNNLGGGASGEWSICGGNSQSYASANGSLAAAAPQQFKGSLANTVSVNALTSQPCSGTACGTAVTVRSVSGVMMALMVMNVAMQVRSSGR
jgi:hypothetical protein